LEEVRMIHRKWALVIAVPLLVLLALGSPAPRGGTVSAQGTLISNGNFEASQASKDLRTAQGGKGWYESRKDEPVGPKLLKLSKKAVAGNATKKAMIKASAKRNTYLTQDLAQPQSARFTMKWDILVKEIQPKQNRGAFQMIGAAGTKGKGPNSSGADRFVFLAFENAAGAKGKIDLFAYEGGGKDPLAKRTIVAPKLDLNKWYTVTVSPDLVAKTYTVSVAGGAPVTVKAFDSGKGPAPKTLTAVSFASWNDGPATFYVDNVQ
jgi:hypothetical protein